MSIRTPRIDNIECNALLAGSVAQAQGYTNVLDVGKISLPTGTGQLGYTSIVNRAQIIDLANDLAVRMGVERIVTQKIFPIQNEQDPNGELVYGVEGDTFGQVRCVGNWVNNSGTPGSGMLSAQNLTDYVEITFYGTGLNLLNQYSGALNAVASVDGGAEGSNIFGSSLSAVISGRNYSANVVIPVCSNLTQGIHTVKIRNNTASRESMIGGFEILNESSALNIRPGTIVGNSSKNILTTAQTPAYNYGFENAFGTHVVTYTLSAALVASNVITTTLNGRTYSTTYASSSDATLQAIATALAGDTDVASAVVTVVGGNQTGTDDRVITVTGKVNIWLALTGTVTLGASQAVITTNARGGCVLTYLKNNGTIGKAVTPTDATALYLTNASHANEELIRTYNWREFGCGRADDFSTLLSTANSDRGFTLEDGTTTLVGSGVSDYQGSLNIGGVGGSFFTITFVGTGLDFFETSVAGTYDTHTIYVDGVSIGTITGAVQTGKIRKICSGLPYGTHTVKIIKNAAVNNSIIAKYFNIYAPKKPSLPSGAVENGQYYIPADYSVSSSPTVGYIGGGVLRKAISGREAVYTGTWNAITFANNFENGLNTLSQASGNTVSYTFFGTGFEWRGQLSNQAHNNTLSVDGSSDFSGFTTTFSQTSSGATFTPSTGLLGGTSAATNRITIQVSGLALGKHTVKFTTNSTSNLYVDSLDVVTPIHSPKPNSPTEIQNTFPVGSCSVGDLRKVFTNAVGDKVTASVSLVANQTISVSSYVPVYSLGLPFRGKGRKVRISYSCPMATGANTYLAIYIDGIPSSVPTATNTNNITALTASDSYVATLSEGVHWIQMYVNMAAGTATLMGGAAACTLKVEEL